MLCMCQMSRPELMMRLYVLRFFNRKSGPAKAGLLNKLLRLCNTLSKKDTVSVNSMCNVMTLTYCMLDVFGLSFKITQIYFTQVVESYKCAQLRIHINKYVHCRFTSR